MKQFPRLHTFCALSILLFLKGPFSCSARTYETTGHDKYSAQWHGIDSLMQLGLTKTAADSVEALLTAAKTTGNSEQNVKALLYRMRLESYREEDALVKSIDLLKREIDDSSFPVRPILQSLLGESYRSFYEHNRWSILNRSSTTSLPNPDDMHTWDLRTIMEHASRAYRQSVHNADELKKVSLASFGSTIIRHREDHLRRPTLYDVLVRRAIDFFSMDDNELTRPAHAFTVSGSAYFVPYRSFCRMTIDTRDTLSLNYHALLLLQKCIAFHTGDRSPEALIDADLTRLAFVRERSAEEQRDSLYLEALYRLQKRFVDHPASAEITHAIATVLYDRAQTWQPFGDDRYRYSARDALARCRKAIEQFPQSYGAGLCRSLADRISAKDMDITSEQVILPKIPFKVLLSYKNIANVYWRQLPISRRQWRNLTRQADRDSIAGVLTAITPIRSWSIAIPDPGDYQTHSVEIAQKPLRTGHYVLLCSTSPDFSCNEAAVAWCALQVTRIGYITRSHMTGAQEYRFLDREHGTPLNGITVSAREQVYDSKRRGYRYTTYGTYTSDRDGKVLIPVKKGQRHSISVICSRGKDTLDSDRSRYLYRYGSEERKMRNSTFFFTDRAIYRPGQTVHFKGIMLRTNGDKSEITKGRQTTVRLYDVNGQEIARLKCTSNDYGSIHGTFTAPTGVLNGRMRIANGEGTAYISVEEYKRPKFSVATDPYKGTRYPGDSIRITGKASAYAGQAIGDAKVQYRVVRNVSIPRFWWSRWFPPRGQGTTEISNGTGTTNDTGGFHIDFVAHADKSYKKSDNPIFTYTISIEVTDITGETQSTRGSVRVGYTALQLGLGISEFSPAGTSIDISLSSTNANNVPVAASGTMTIHRLSAPNAVYRSRLWKRPDTSVIPEIDYRERFPTDCFSNEDDITTWKRGKRVYRGTFNTKKDSLITPKRSNKWQPGIYVAEGKTVDRNGKAIVATRYFTIYSESGSKPPRPVTDEVITLKDSGEPGETVRFMIGTGYTRVRVLYEIERKRKIVSTQWVKLNNSQKLIELPINENDRGGFSVHFTFMRDNRTYQHTKTVAVPWSNKKLDISFATFREKLSPGEKEQWRLKIRGEKSDKIAAEMVAALYDASLDAFTPHHWAFSIYPTYSPRFSWRADDGFSLSSSQLCATAWNSIAPYNTRHDPSLNLFGYGFSGGGGRYGYGGGSGSKNLMRLEKTEGLPPPSPRRAMPKKAKSAPAAFAEGGSAESIDHAILQGVGGLKSGGGAPSAMQPADGTGGNTPDLSTISARTNLNETAFFFPSLTTSNSGEIIVNFTIPEALTRWNMLGFAHTKDLCYGQITTSLVTRKELMVVPHPPRFFRENDHITFTAKVSNLSKRRLDGTAQLFLFDATTMQPVDKAFGNTSSSRGFQVKQGKSTPLAWKLSIPEGISAVSVRVVAQSGTFSDGEEQIIPVLTNRMLVTESVPLSIRKKGTKKFTLPNLLSRNNNSKTLRNHRLTLEFTENPVWYAVQALPYLIEYPYECAEQLFSRFYANSLASHIVNSSPRIKKVFDQWRDHSPDALLSTLEKNSELKALALEETPWLLDGKNESERKRRVALLFDLNTMADGKTRALQRLGKMQLANGGWPWFEGSPDDRYITQYIATGFGRLIHLSVLDMNKNREVGRLLESALQYLDERIKEDYNRILSSPDPEADHLSELHIQYLYMRSFFPDDDISSANRKAFDYFTGQAEKYWLRKRRYMQGMIALALHRSGAEKLPATIVRSLKENAVVNEESGMYWKEMYEGRSWWWYQAPIEAQSLMIEAFEEVARDTAAVEACKTWLLKSKQTQNWGTTKATAEACYALLLRGTGTLDQPAGISLQLGTTTVDPSQQPDLKTEAGTGYFKTTWSGKEIQPEMGTITVTSRRNGVAWGAVYWQYFEQLDKITHTATPLNIDKQLFLRTPGDNGPVLSPISKTTALEPGDRITVRIELRVDRDMEYVHMKDMRASGFEPLNVFSGYRWQDGLGYYESTRDAATNFFFSVLRKGTYVFEYPLVVAHAGNFSNGITTVQCMYAPEFTSQSEGIRLKVGR